MNNESWQIIDEFPIYSVSNIGRIRNDKTGYVLQGGYDRDGYRQVTISYNGKQYNRRICRLVAIAFIPDPQNLPLVNHKDEDKSNDRVENLEWCTVAYNNNYGKRTQATRKKVMCVETGKIYDGVRIASRVCNIPHSNIGISCRSGGIAGGYHWQFV